MENTTESKNPMGESKAKGGVGRVLAIAIAAFVVVFGGLVALGYFAYNAVKNVDDYSWDSDSFVDTTPLDDGLDALRAQVADETLSTEERRDLQISIMLTTYSSVVDATASSVSWEEYIDALDHFITELDALYAIDADEQLKKGVDLFHEARELYVDSIHFDDPSAAVESEGVEQASAMIQEAQAAVNLYLSELDSASE